MGLLPFLYSFSCIFAVSYALCEPSSPIDSEEKWFKEFGKLYANATGISEQERQRLTEEALQEAGYRQQRRPKEEKALTTPSTSNSSASVTSTVGPEAGKPTEKSSMEKILDKIRELFESD